MLYFVHNNVPHTKEYDLEVKNKNEIEDCANSVYPNINYVQRMVVVGVYRTPKKTHPSYEEVFKQRLQLKTEQQCAAILPGGFDINAWENGNQQ